MAYKGTLAGGYWVFVYLTNGSARNVWSSTLVESTMAVAAPQEFPHAVLSERLIAYALDDSTDATTQMRSWLRVGHGVPTGELERAINADGYAIRESLGAGNALRVFALNTTLYQIRPMRGTAWPSVMRRWVMQRLPRRCTRRPRRWRSLRRKPCCRAKPMLG